MLSSLHFTQANFPTDLATGISLYDIMREATEHLEWVTALPCSRQAADTISCPLALAFPQSNQWWQCGQKHHTLHHCSIPADGIPKQFIRHGSSSQLPPDVVKFTHITGNLVTSSRHSQWAIVVQQKQLIEENVSAVRVFVNWTQAWNLLLFLHQCLSK